MQPHSNLAANLSASTVATMGACSDACGANAACKYWAYDFASTACTLHELLNIDLDALEPNWVGGDRTCASSDGVWKNLTIRLRLLIIISCVFLGTLDIGVQISLRRTVMVLN